MNALRFGVVTASAAATVAVAATSGSSEVNLTATTALIMGGTGIPTPNQEYLDAAVNTYIKPALGGDYNAIALYTPEEGLGTLPGETMSIAESTRAGMPYLEAAIAARAGEPLVVFGYSQSGALGAMVKNRLAAYAEAHPDEPVPEVTFVLLACGCRANGAQEFRQGNGYDTSIVDTRARTDTPFKTIDVAWQYDLSSDAPLYPINLLADLNWLLGGLYVHSNYLPMPSELGGHPNGGQQRSLDGLEGVTAPGLDTTYYFIPSENLPLFGPLRSLGVPESLIDIIEPVARVIVEWGYDRTIPPWQPTTYRLIPRINPVTAAVDLVNAVGEGFVNVLKAIGLLPATKLAGSSVSRATDAALTDTPTSSVSPVDDEFAATASQARVSVSPEPASETPSSNEPSMPTAEPLGDTADARLVDLEEANEAAPIPPQADSDADAVVSDSTQSVSGDASAAGDVPEDGESQRSSDDEVPESEKRQSEGAPGNRKASGSEEDDKQPAESDEKTSASPQ